MDLTLNQVAGFSDLPDSVFDAQDIAFALHMGHVAVNAQNGMVRMEIFQGLYANGDVVPLPQSKRDKYNYSRNELTYLWTVRHSGEAKSGWMSNGTDGHSLWFCNWLVQQYDPNASVEVNKDAGKVTTSEWYRRSGDHRDETSSTDGLVLVFTIAQRQQRTLLMAAAPTYNVIDEADIATDKPLTTSLAKALNNNAKFGNVNTEVIYLGEYVNGQTVALPISPADAYSYQASECQFMFSWRWTTLGTTYKQPDTGIGISGIFGVSGDLGQMGPLKASIDASGLVAVSVTYIGDDSVNVVRTDHGRIAAFAFCTRAATPASPPLAESFEELDNNFFMPGEDLEASVLLAIKKNIDEAIVTPEFFGPTEYKNGDIIPLAVGRDTHVYTREEIQYLWTWSDTTNQTGTHLRLPFFQGVINESTGLVTLHVWRLPPGSGYVDDNDSLCRIRVLVIGSRESQLPELTDQEPNPPLQGAGGDPTEIPPDAILGSGPDAEVSLAPSGGGDFTVAHGFGGTPALVLIQMTSGGNIWFQSPTRYDGTNLYLTASDAGVTGKALLFSTGAQTEIDLAPAADGNFAVAHSLGATPALVVVQMTSGGNIWSQPAVADNSLIYLTASSPGVTGKAALWLALTGEGSPLVSRKQLGLSASAPGNFQVQHQLGVTPLAVLIHMNSPGFPAFWFQSTRYDDVNIYLVSPDSGITGFAEILYAIA